jgi:hypothetical protein
MKLTKEEKQAVRQKHNKLESKFWKMSGERAILLEKIDSETNELKKKALRTQLRKLDEKTVNMSNKVEKSYLYNNLRPTKWQK